MALTEITTIFHSLSQRDSEIISNQGLDITLDTTLVPTFFMVALGGRLVFSGWKVGTQDKHASVSL